MSQIKRCNYCRTIVRVNVGNKMRFHFESAVCLCPVFKRKVHCTRAKVRTADTNLADLCIFFTFFVYKFSAVHFICKIGDFFLLVQIKLALVYAVSNNVFSKLTACKLVKNHTLFTCVYDFTVIQRFKFFKELRFFCKFRKSLQDLLIHLFCSIIVRKTFCHRNRIVLYSFCRISRRKFLCNRNHSLEGQQLFPG